MAVGKDLANLFITVGMNAAPALAGMNAIKAAAASTGATLYTALGPVIGALAGAFAIKEMVGAAIEGEEATQGLASALETAGRDTDDLMPRFAELAKELESSTRVQDEATFGLLTLGSNLGVPAEKLDTMAKSAIGLSTALGIDAKTAMAQLSKETQGVKSTLERSIPALKGVEDQQERLAILSELAGKGFQQEQDLAGTLGGSLTQLWNAIGNLAEALGTILAPVIQAAANGLKSLSLFLQDAVESWQGTISSIYGAVGDFVSKIAAYWEMFGGKTMEIFAGVGETFTWLAGQIGEFVGWAGGEIGSFIDEAVFTFLNLDLVLTEAGLWVNNFSAAISDTFSYITEVISSFGIWLGENWTEIWTTALQNSLQIMQNWADNLTAIITEAMAFIRSGGTDAFDPLIKSWDENTKKLSKPFKLPAFKDSFDLEQMRQGLDEEWNKRREAWDNINTEQTRDIFTPGELEIIKKSDKDKTKDKGDSGSFQNLGSAWKNATTAAQKLADKQRELALKKQDETNKLLKSVDDKLGDMEGGLA